MAIFSISESSNKPANNARKFVMEVKKLANRYNLDFFVVTEGASGYSCSKNTAAVKHARKCHTEWERKNSIDPDHDWSNEED